MPVTGDDVFELAVHEESEIWTSLSHLRKVLALLQLASNPGEIKSGRGRPGFARLQDKIWVRKAWVRGYTMLVSRG